MNEKTSLSNDTPRVPEFAHYYGDFIWDEELTGWIKSLLLFFDGIALALPPATADRLIEANPVLAQPLAEFGLLRNYDPYLWTDPDLWIKVPPRIKEWERFLTQVWPIVQRMSQGESTSEKDSRDSDLRK